MKKLVLVLAILAMNACGSGSGNSVGNSLGIFRTFDQLDAAVTELDEADPIFPQNAFGIADTAEAEQFIIDIFNTGLTRIYDDAENSTDNTVDGRINALRLPGFANGEAIFSSSVFGNPWNYFFTFNDFADAGVDNSINGYANAQWRLEGLYTVVVENFDLDVNLNGLYGSIVISSKSYENGPEGEEWWNRSQSRFTIISGVNTFECQSGPDQAPLNCIQE